MKFIDEYLRNSSAVRKIRRGVPNEPGMCPARRVEANLNRCATMSERELLTRIDNLIEELIARGTRESAAVASILLATRAALRDGLVIEVSRAIWQIVDERSLERDEPLL